MYAIGTRSGGEEEAELAPEYMLSLSPRGVVAGYAAAYLNPLAAEAIQVSLLAVRRASEGARLGREV